MPVPFFTAPLSRILTNTVKLFFAFHLFGAFVGNPQLTDGPSMLPVLNVRGDYLWTSTLHRRGKGVKVGDLVTFIHPLAPEAGACKRVLGMPGDYVMRDSPGSGSDMMVQVPEGHCWIAGDNYPWSRDSRDYGPIPLALIRGKVTARVWPPNKFKWIENGLLEIPR